MTKRKTARAAGRNMQYQSQPLPTQQPVVTRTAGPQITTTGGTIRVKNTEAFYSLAVPPSSQNFNNWVSKDFTPASNSLWCGGIAKCYALYRIHSLKFRFVPTLGTGNNGYVAMCAIYTSEDRQNWFALGSSSDTSMFSQFAQGPIWAGGGLVGSNNQGYSGMPMEVVVDTTAAHRRVPWYVVDGYLNYPMPPNQPNFPEIDNSVAVSLGLTYNANTVLSPGTVFVSYDIEFCNPVPPLANLSYANQPFAKKALGGGVWTADPNAPPPREVRWQDETDRPQEPDGV